MVSLLAQRGRDQVMSVREMQEMGLPRSFLVKIAKSLVDAGIVGAKEGRGGGYYLKGKPERVTLKKLVEVLEGKVATTACVAHGMKCPMADKCPHRLVMKRLSDELEGVLDRYTISDLSKGK